MQMATVWIREKNFFPLFFTHPFQLAAAQLLYPSEGAARIGQLGQEKGTTSPLNNCVLVDYIPREETVPTYILSRFFLFLRLKLCSLLLILSLLSCSSLFTIFSQFFFLCLTQSSLHSQLLSLKLLHSSLKHAALQVEQHISVQL